MTDQPVINPDEIHEFVRERYGSIARSANAGTASSCCGPSAATEVSCCGGEAGSCNTTLYDPALLEGLPVDVSGLSLGCERTQFARSNTSCCAA